MTSLGQSMEDYVTKAAPAKKDALAALEERLDKITAVIFTDYRGLSVSETNQLRSDFHKADGEAEFLVVKNTIMRMALENKGIEITDPEMLKGPTAIGMAEEPVTPAKTLAAFAKKHDKLAFKGVLVDGEFYGADKVKDFAEMPSKEELLAGVVGGVAAPLQQFVGLLNEIVRSTLAVIEAVIEKKKEEEGAA